MKIGIIVTICTMVLAIGYGQNNQFSYKVSLYLPDETNSDNAIHCLARDQYGFIWGGSNNGLVRFNGYEFDRIVSTGFRGHFPSGRINALCYNNGHLFIGSDKGVFLFNTTTYETKRLPGYEFDSTDVVVQLACAAPDKLWWFSTNGFLHTNYNGKYKRRFIFGTNTIPNLFMVLYQNDIWIYREFEGIYRINAVTLEVKKIYAITSDDELVKKLSVYEGSLYFGSGNGVFQYTNNQDTFIKSAEFDDNGANMTALEKGFVYARYGYQLVHQYETEMGMVQGTITLPVKGPHRLHEIMHQDGQVYIASSTGLIHMQVYPSRFQLFHNSYLPNQKSYDVPRGIAEDSLNYYLGTYNFLIAINKRSGKQDTLIKTPLYIHWILLQSDTIWLCTEGKGLYVYNISSRKNSNLFYTHDGEPLFLSCADTWGVDTLITAGYTHLILYQKSKKRKQQIFIKKDGIKLNNISYNQIISIDEGRCLIATSNGVYLVNRSFECLYHFKPSVKEDKLANYVNAITVAKDSTIWMGTRNGIFIFDFSGNMLHKYNTDNGLSGNRIAFLEKDKANHIWAGTFTGLSSIHAESRLVTNYFLEDGLPDTEFNHSASFCSNNGDLILGTISGYVKFSPATLPVSSHEQARILVSKVIYGTAKGETQVLHPAYFSDARLSLGKDVNYLKVYFASDALFAQRNISYQYKIEGVHAGWLDMGKEPFIYLDAIKQGTLRIHIKLSNGSGSSGVLEDVLEVDVQEYFYRQTWFYGLVFGLLLLISIAYIRVLLNKEKSLQKLRSDISCDLHDEIGSYLTALNMNIDFLQKHKGREDGYLDNIRALCRKSILALKDGLWSLDARSDNAEQLWDRLKTIAEELLEPLQIDYEFSETTGLDFKMYKFSILEKRNLLFIVKECITNIIKHGAGSTVYFNFIQHEQKLSFVIENMISPKAGTFKEGGLGLENIKKRMENIKGQATIESHSDKFIITLKLDFLYDPFRNYRR